MSTELTFKRPDRVEIHVRMSDRQYLYVTILQMVGRAFEARCQHLVATLSVPRSACELVEIGGTWSIDIGDTSFYFQPDEAQQIQERFGLKVRHIAARVAS